MSSTLQNKSILVTGGTGSIGSEIVRQALKYDPRVVRVFSNDENGQFCLQKELQGHQNVRFLLGDVRDKDRLVRATEGIDVVFHAAALKHVPFCEYNPFEAVKTNVVGTQNLLEAVLDKEVGKVIAISTDKAVNPGSTMGATKLLEERLVIAANYYKGDRKTVFSSVRFGNVIGSRGSVIPLFTEQIRRGEAVTITDNEMSRFMMSPIQAVSLVFKVLEMALGGEIFIFKMPTLKISDLVKVMIDELAPQYGFKPSQIEVKVTGTRPGEKLFEELMTEEEARCAQETDDMFIVLPHIELSTCRIENNTYPGGQPAQVTKYTSKDGRFLTEEGIRLMLRELSLYTNLQTQHSASSGLS